eukprot:2396809-Rhodomonas_salina.1
MCEGGVANPALENVDFVATLPQNLGTEKPSWTSSADQCNAASGCQRLHEAMIWIISGWLGGDLCCECRERPLQQACSRNCTEGVESMKKLMDFDDDFGPKLHFGPEKPLQSS